MKVLIVLVGVIAAASAVSFFELVHEEWKSFKVRTFSSKIYFLFVYTAFMIVIPIK